MLNIWVVAVGMGPDKLECWTEKGQLCGNISADTEVPLSGFALESPAFVVVFPHPHPIRHASLLIPAHPCVCSFSI